MGRKVLGKEKLTLRLDPKTIEVLYKEKKNTNKNINDIVEEVIKEKYKLEMKIS